MKLDFGRALIWIGRKRNRPITYDDLIDAETRAFEAEERLAGIATVAAAATQTGQYSQRLEANLRTIRNLAGPVVDATRKSGSGEEGEPCNRCGGQNAVWSASSPLWNAVSPSGRVWDESRQLWIDPPATPTQPPQGSQVELEGAVHKWLAGEIEAESKRALTATTAEASDSHRAYQRNLEALQAQLQRVEEENRGLRQRVALKMDDKDAAVLRAEAKREADRATQAEGRIEVEAERDYWKRKWDNDGTEGHELLGDVEAELKAMTQARDLCKQQTAEANARHGQTKERQEKILQAWRQETARATQAEARIEEAVEEFEARAKAIDSQKGPIGDWGLGERDAYESAASFLRSQPSSEVEPAEQIEPDILRTKLGRIRAAVEADAEMEKLPALRGFLIHESAAGGEIEGR